MKTPTPEETAAATNRGIFQGLAKILAMLATRMQTQEEAATQIARLVPRAEELAAQARALAVVRIPESGAAAELEAFTEETEKLAQRAAREAAASRAAGAILKGQAAELGAVARTLDGVNDKALIRSRLRSLLETLAALPARLKAVKAVAADVASLGSSARDLADSTQGLQANARNPGIIATALYRGLRDFADTAATVASSMADDAERVRQSIGNISAWATQLGSPGAAAVRSEATAIGRMQAVVTRGAAAQPARGIVWGQ